MKRLEQSKQWMEESGEYTQEQIDEAVENRMQQMEDPKGKYSWTPSEQEWKFYDVTDMWPVRIVE